VWAGSAEFNASCNAQTVRFVCFIVLYFACGLKSRVSSDNISFAVSVVRAT
jgi:hypothetical protein